MGEDVPSPAEQGWVRIVAIVRDFLGLLASHWTVLAPVWAGASLGIYGLGALGRAFGVTGVPLGSGLDLTLVATALLVGVLAHRLLWPWRPELSECLDVALRAFLPMLATLFLARLAIAVGFAMLILPGLVVAVFVSLAPIVLMAEGPGIGRAFRESVRLVARDGWVVFGALIAGYLMFALAFAMLSLVWAFALGSANSNDAGFAAALSALMSLFQTVMATAIYRQLKSAGDVPPLDAGGGAG